MERKVNDRELFTMQIKKGTTIIVDAAKYKDLLYAVNMKALLNGEFRELKEENERLRAEVDRMKSKQVKAADFIHIDVFA